MVTQAYRLAADGEDEGEVVARLVAACGLADTAQPGGMIGQAVGQASVPADAQARALDGLSPLERYLVESCRALPPEGRLTLRQSADFARFNAGVPLSGHLAAGRKHALLPTE